MLNVFLEYRTCDHALGMCTRQGGALDLHDHEFNSQPEVKLQELHFWQPVLVES